MKNGFKYYQGVSVINFGGTIDMSSGIVDNQVSRLTDRIKQKLRIDVFNEDIEFDPTDSSNIGDEQWNLLFNKIKEIVGIKRSFLVNYLDEQLSVPNVGGIVIAHGTDTLQSTSLAIALQVSLYDLFLPIVFTGSWASPENKNSDSLGNLEKSIKVASGIFGLVIPPQVYVVIGKDIHLASRLTKVFSKPNSDGKYFFSFPSPVGSITTKKDNPIIFEEDYLRTLTDINHFRVNKYRIKEKDNLTWGKVDHILLNTPNIINILKDLKYRIINSQKNNINQRYGIILQGNLPLRNHHNELEKLEFIMKIFNLISEISNIGDGIPIFVGTKKTEIRLKRAGIKNVDLIHSSLLYSKARLKLSWLLKLSLSVKEIIEFMNVNIAGEIFETQKLPEWIKYENFLSDTEIEQIIIYPNIDIEIIQDAINRLNNKKNTKRLILYGFGDGHIPIQDIGNKSLNEIVNNYCKNTIDKEINIEILPNEITILKGVEMLDKTLLNLTTFLCALNNENLIELLNKFEILNHNTILKNELLKLKISMLSKELRIKFINKMRDYIVEFKGGMIDDIKIKNNGINESFKFIFNKELMYQDVMSEMEKKEKSELYINTISQLLAKKIIKIALMKNSKILNVLGKAIDDHITIDIKTSVYRAYTDTSNYEVGRMLLAIGVGSDLSRKWQPF